VAVKQTRGKLKQANTTGLIFIVISIAIFVLSSLWFFSKLLQSISPVKLEDITGYQILTSPKSRIDMKLAPTDSNPSCFDTHCTQIVMEIQKINYVEHKVYGGFHIKIPHNVFLDLKKGNESIAEIVIDPVTQGNDLVFIDPETAKKT
jgi:hypothetical protein